jgi:hypothetical protein
MNYILYEVMGEVVEQVRQALSLPVLNYQYGYLEELDATLQQYAQDPNYAAQRFPLVWLKPRFKILRTSTAYYGEVKDLRLFVMHATDPDLKAKDRLERNYKPVIYPIYHALLEQLNQHPAISAEYHRAHVVIDDFYWGDTQGSYLAGPVDCLTIENLTLSINTKPCQQNL